MIILLAKCVVAGLALLLVAFTLLPLIRADSWWIRILDFPRVQLAVLLVGLLLAYLLLLLWRRDHLDLAVIPLVLLSTAWQLYCIAPYTPIATPMVQDSRQGTASGTGHLRVLISNVEYDNRQAEPLLNLIDHYEPDLVLALEPTAWWAEQLQPLKQRYPYAIDHAQENHYGIILYSRLKLVEPKVRFLVSEDVPSIRTRVELPSGELVWFYGVHPRPPGLRLPRQDERVDSTQRDAELVLIGRELAKRDEPAIVAGDFNDVAWSHTTALFKRLSRLLDPRVGRGLYNSFHAERPLLRYPLDHIFVSDAFRLHEMRRLSYVGSDHFPIYVDLSHEPEAAAVQEAAKMQPGDHEEAVEQLREQQQQQA